MKKFKKIMAVLVAAVLMIATMVPAFAAAANENLDSNTSKYTIRIGNGVAGESYYAYKVFDVTLTDEEHGVTPNTSGFAYTIDSDGDGSWCWNTIKGTLNSSTGVYTNSTLGLTFTPSMADSSVYVVTFNSPTAAQTADLAVALNGIADKSSAKGGNIPAYNTSNAKDIEVEKLGYYLVDTSLGALCSLDTTNQDVTIYEKNAQPNITKKVKDHDDANYTDTADVHGGDTIDYQLTVNTGTNTATTKYSGSNTSVDKNYVITDELPAGITMSDAQVAALAVKVDTTDWEKSTATQSKDYTVSYDASARKLTITLIARKDDDTTTTTVTETASRLWDIAENTNIVITYSATVNRSAESDVALENTATLKYSEQEYTDSAKVYTWSFDTLKYTGTLNNLADVTKLSDATFQLYNSDKTAVLQLISEGNNVYRYDSRIQSVVLTNHTATTQVDSADATVVDQITTDSTGIFKIKGLDSSTYYLRETAAPHGYHLQTTDAGITISSSESSESLTKSTTGTTAIAASSSDSTTAPYLAIENTTSAELPSTGGMGTTVLYIVGGMLVILAGAYLYFSRKRTA